MINCREAIIFFRVCHCAKTTKKWKWWEERKYWKRKKEREGLREKLREEKNKKEKIREKKKEIKLGTEEEKFESLRL